MAAVTPATVLFSRPSDTEAQSPDAFGALQSRSLSPGQTISETYGSASSGGLGGHEMHQDLDDLTISDGA